MTRTKEVESIDGLDREAITWAYRMILGREPESAAVVDDYMRAVPDRRTLRHILIRSPEFLCSVPQCMTLDGGEPVRTVDVDGDPALLGKLFDHVNQSWVHLGETDPYWSVLSAPEYHGLPSAEGLSRFFATGAGDVQRMLLALSRCGVELPSSGVCLEYGCGLGRITRHLAKEFDRVIGVDISRAHLELAKKHAYADSVDGIEWLHLESLADVGKLPEVDFIYSVIVLQHNPPPVIKQVVSAFANMLRPGGIAYFQVPTYRADYEFRLPEYVRDQMGKREMEMHVLPQETIFELFLDSGCRPLSVVEDGCTGLRRGERSNTFIFKKRA